MRIRKKATKKRLEKLNRLKCSCCGVNYPLKKLNLIPYGWNLCTGCFNNKNKGSDKLC